MLILSNKQNKNLLRSKTIPDLIFSYNYQNLNVIGMAFNGFKSPSINKISFTA